MSRLSGSFVSTEGQEFFEHLTYSKNGNTAYNYDGKVDAFLKFVRKNL